MEAEELLTKAWQAVAASGVPEALHETAFKEALALLRDTADAGPNGSTDQSGKPSRGRSRRTRASRATSPPPNADGAQPVDEDTFFEQLAHESGIAKNDLRDVLHLTADGVVQVVPPTRRFGNSQAEQARAIISLVAGARSRGLDERPIDAQAVRDELERKRCYQTRHFAEKHLGPLRGFNAGSNRNEIFETSRWLNDFEAAVNRAHGRSAAEDTS